MALTKCPECGKNVSTKAASCPSCGYPISTSDKTAPVPPELPPALPPETGNAAQKSGPSPEMLAFMAEYEKTAKKKPADAHMNGCLGCLGVAALIFIIGLMFTPPHQDSHSYQLGHEMGFITGNIAMRQGRVMASDSEKEAEAWSFASRFTSDSQEQKQDWVNGYKAGWDDGYTRH
jgi:zinc ribbon protein